MSTILGGENREVMPVVQYAVALGVELLPIVRADQYERRAFEYSGSRRAFKVYEDEVASQVLKVCVTTSKRLLTPEI